MNRSTHLFLTAILLAASSAFACQVPVFRYALEQWSSDKYEVIILHDGPIRQSDQSNIEALRSSADAAHGIVNAEFRVVEASSLVDDPLAAIWSQHGQSDEPIVAVLYPQQAQELPDRLVQVTPLSKTSTEYLAQSPVRQEIAKRLLAGESAVWVFVPCGDAKQDEEAFKTLKRELLVNEAKLELPDQDEIEADDVTIEATHIELRIAFSIVTAKRDDPAEKFLLNSLLRSESDLPSLDQPMAFPVLGRGRVLYALVGKGISADTIAMASSFVVGPCSCQVKNLNPGFDLLLSVDWDEALSGPKMSKELPSESSEPVLLTIPPGRTKR